VKNEKLNCLLWLVVFVALCGGCGWFVWRRAAQTTPAVIGGLVGGILALIVVSWLLAIPTRIGEWLLVIRARMGSEPRDGKKVAIIGTLRGNGTLAAPFSHKTCVAYSYEMRTQVVTRSGNKTTIQNLKAYDGFSTVQLAVEHGAGTDRTRILAIPAVDLDDTEPTDMTARLNAQQYVETTQWNDGVTTVNDDLTASDGHVRRDDRLRADADVAACALVEKILPGNIPVCAIGRYAEDKRALVAPVMLRRGETYAIQMGWRVFRAALGVVVFGAIFIAAALIFCANYPLDAAEAAHPDWNLSWREIEFDRFIETQVRAPMVKAGMLSERSGFYLQEVPYDTAKGELIVNGRTIELRHSAYVGDRAVHISARPDDPDGITLKRGDRVVVTVDGKDLNIPTSWWQPNDVVTSLGSGPVADYAGRITIMAPDRWLRARVTFRTRVNTDDWLREQTPQDQQ